MIFERLSQAWEDFVNNLDAEQPSQRSNNGSPENGQEANQSHDAPRAQHAVIAGEVCILPYDISGWWRKVGEQLPGFRTENCLYGHLARSCRLHCDKGERRGFELGSSQCLYPLVHQPQSLFVVVDCVYLFAVEFERTVSNSMGRPFSVRGCSMSLLHFRPRKQRSAF